jgi:hemoglobin
MKRFCMLLVCLLSIACMRGSKVEAEADDALFRALGGLDGINSLVDALIDEYRADDRINQLFQMTDFDYFKARLVEDICVKSGGECEYQGLSMEEAHSGMNISEAEFNWFVEDSRRAMEKVGLDVGTQNQLLAILARERETVIRQ